MSDDRREALREMTAAFHRAYCLSGNVGVWHTNPPCGERADRVAAALAEAAEPAALDVERLARVLVSYYGIEDPDHDAHAIASTYARLAREDAP